MARRVQREKPNSTQWSKVWPLRKNKKKEIDVGSETSSWKFDKGKMKGTKQDVSLKRCNATLMLLRIKSYEAEQSCTVFCGNTLKLLTKSEDVRKL